MHTLVSVYFLTFIAVKRWDLGMQEKYLHVDAIAYMYCLSKALTIYKIRSAAPKNYKNVNTRLSCEISKDHFGEARKNLKFLTHFLYICYV